MKSPEESLTETPTNDYQELDRCLPTKPVDSFTEAGPEADITAEKEDTSSAGSEVEEEVGEVTDASKRRRVQNSQFEALQVLSSSFVLTQANFEPDFPGVPNQVLLSRVKLHVRTSPKLSSLLLTWQQGRIWDLGRWILGNTSWNCSRGPKYRIQSQF